MMKMHALPRPTFCNSTKTVTDQFFVLQQMEKKNKNPFILVAEENLIKDMCLRGLTLI